METNNKSWFKRNLFWVVSLFIIVSVAIYFLGIASNNKNITDVLKAYSEQELYNDAIDLAKKNVTVIQVLGELESIDKTAILEGTVLYSKSYDTISTSVRLKGDNARGRLDILATKVDEKWQYNRIKIRVKKPKEKKQTIEILNLE